MWVGQSDWYNEYHIQYMQIKHKINDQPCYFNNHIDIMYTVYTRV